MKKKLMMLALVLMMAFTMAACSSAEGTEETEEAEEGNQSFTPKELPCDMQLNDATLTLTDVEVYRETSESGYGYYPCVVVTFDISELSDSDYYWMQEDNSLMINCYYESEDNNVDFTTLDKLKGYHDDDADTITYFFYDNSEESKYDFTDVELMIRVVLFQDEEYEEEDDNGEVSSHRIQMSYNIYVNRESLSDITVETKDIEEMDEYTRNLFESARS